ncbi:hypothetical protein SNARM312S_03036 [Streptomyces narbonensis]
MTAMTQTEKTGARTDEAATLIGGARERIDSLDDRIIGLIQERMAVWPSSRRPGSPPAAAG